MALDWSPSRRLAAVAQFVVGVALLPFEPQYGALVLGHHVVVRRLRPLTPAERLYVTAGIAFHTVGVIYPEHLYRAVDWYDNVAHVMAGSLVAGLLVIVGNRYTDSEGWVAVFAVLALVPIGLGWEMYEFRVPHLTVYGWRDTASDIWYNLLGGCLLAGYRTLRRFHRSAVGGMTVQG